MRSPRKLAFWVWGHRYAAQNCIRGGRGTGCLRQGVARMRGASQLTFGRAYGRAILGRQVQRSFGRSSSGGASTERLVSGRSGVFHRRRVQGVGCWCLRTRGTGHKRLSIGPSCPDLWSGPGESSPRRRPGARCDHRPPHLGERSKRRRGGSLSGGHSPSPQGRQPRRGPRIGQGRNLLTLGDGRTRSHERLRRSPKVSGQRNVAEFFKAGRITLTPQLGRLPRVS